MLHRRGDRRSIASLSAWSAGAVVGLAFLSGCATPGDNSITFFADPAQYQYSSCEQLSVLNSSYRLLSIRHSSASAWAVCKWSMGQRAPAWPAGIESAILTGARGRLASRRIPLPPECLPRAACLGGDGGTRDFPRRTRASAQSTPPSAAPSASAAAYCDSRWRRPASRFHPSAMGSRAGCAGRACSACGPS